jgi:hypothetical protein
MQQPSEEKRQDQRKNALSSRAHSQLQQGTCYIFYYIASSGLSTYPRTFGNKSDTLSCVDRQGLNAG